MLIEYTILKGQREVRDVVQVRKGSFSLIGSREKHPEPERDSGELRDVRDPILAGSTLKQGSG